LGKGNFSPFKKNNFFKSFKRGPKEGRVPPQQPLKKVKGKEEGFKN